MVSIGAGGRGTFAALLAVSRRSQYQALHLFLIVPEYCASILDGCSLAPSTAEQRATKPKQKSMSLHVFL